ncbi:hypothetical protein B0H16DRAFT_1450893 [Mycena metata]|uniref:Uncharacterized protein n=1 Tax=Mycena metata TaxID=1033252 RepID=A0AAD7K069_9AGAR|nr:hypothetical protein B0H16DRAFT_1450893 [Mycena metata]
MWSDPSRNKHELLDDKMDTARTCMPSGCLVNEPSRTAELVGERARTMERRVYGDNVPRCRQEEHYPSRDVLAQDGIECREALRAHVVWHGSTWSENRRNIKPRQSQLSGYCVVQWWWDDAACSGRRATNSGQAREPMSRPGKPSKVQKKGAFQGGSEFMNAERSIFNVETTAPREVRKPNSHKRMGPVAASRSTGRLGNTSLPGSQGSPHHQLPPRQSPRRSAPRTPPLLGSEGKGRETVKKRDRSGATRRKKGDEEIRGIRSGTGTGTGTGRAMRYDGPGTIQRTGNGHGPGQGGTGNENERGRGCHGVWGKGRGAREWARGAGTGAGRWNGRGARERARGTRTGAWHGNGRGAREWARGTGTGAGHENGREARVRARARARYENEDEYGTGREPAYTVTARRTGTGTTYGRGHGNGRGHENERGMSAARERARSWCENEHGTGWRMRHEAGARECRWSKTSNPHDNLINASPTTHRTRSSAGHTHGNLGL